LLFADPTACAVNSFATMQPFEMRIYLALGDSISIDDCTRK
jgi:hypothetical protein